MSINRQERTNMEQQTVTEANLAELPIQNDFNPNKSFLDGRLDLIKDVNVNLHVQLGSCQLSIAQLSTLKNGELLTLDKMPDEPVDIILGDTVIAKGRLVVVEEHFGVRIEQMAQIDQ